MGKIKHVIWDWNGTLYNDAAACVETLNVILKRRDLPSVDLAQYMDIFRFPVKEYYEILGFDFSKENWDSMAKEFHDIYFEASKAMRLRDGVVGVLERLSGNGVAMSVLSASEEGVLERLLSSYGIRSFFQNVSGLTDIYASSKLDAGRKLVGSLSLNLSEVILIGDTLHDYEVASDIGCRCILLAGGHQSEERLRQCGCTVYKDVNEVEKLWQ